MCMMAAMILSAEQFPMKTETSPKTLRGLTHREIGDFTDSFAVLMESPEPFIDKFVGPMTEDLMVTGRDEFEQTAADRGLLYTDYNIKTGASIDYRVARHLGAAAEIVKQMGEFYPAKRWARLADYAGHEKNVGHYLHGPEGGREVFTNWWCWRCRRCWRCFVSAGVAEVPPA
jgi:hypothetical protein